MKPAYLYLDVASMQVRRDAVGVLLGTLPNPSLLAAAVEAAGNTAARQEARRLAAACRVAHAPRAGDGAGPGSGTGKEEAGSGGGEQQQGALLWEAGRHREEAVAAARQLADPAWVEAAPLSEGRAVARRRDAAAARAEYLFARLSGGGGGGPPACGGGGGVDGAGTGVAGLRELAARWVGARLDSDCSAAEREDFVRRLREEFVAPHSSASRAVMGAGTALALHGRAAAARAAVRWR
jgi:hypothetical protein